SLNPPTTAQGGRSRPEEIDQMVAVFGCFPISETAGSGTMPRGAYCPVSLRGISPVDDGSGASTEGKRMSMTRILIRCAVGLCLTVSAFAQDYPTRQVQVINPFPVGLVDTIAHTVSQKLSELWGQPVVVEGRPGAGGTVGAGVVAKAPPDGYTLLLTSSAHAVQPALYTTLPYDPLKDFV